MQPMNPVLQECFAEPLHDLGDDDARLRGIVTPESERGAAKSGVSAQFLENAGDYHERYNNVEWFRTLIARYLGGPSAAGERCILDIGSGSGNSVIPLLDLYPAAFVVATDISPQLLVILRDYLEARPGYRGRYGLVCMDANNDRFRPGAFDLAVGAAILHHIVDPRRVLRVCASALRPEGAALFIEPFEVGHGVLRIAYRRVLAEARRRGERGKGFKMLQRMVVDHEVRMRDKSDPIFDVVDDKWHFTRAFFENATRGPEWRECRVEAINGDATPMVDQARMELRLGMGLDESALPRWAWDTIREHEGYFSRDARRDMIFEGAVVLRRSANAAPRPVDERRQGWWWNPSQPGRGFFVEFHAGSARAVCCAYADDGEPAWSVAEPEALELSGRAARIRLKLPASSVSLEPQHAGLAGGHRTGWWIEDREAPASSIVVEELGDRIMAALLSHDGWSLVVGSRHSERTFEGDWLRFTGGQTLSGPHRTPVPRTLGRARLSWIEEEGCLLALLPDGRRQLYRRLRDDEAVPQNFRSMENCAS
jgi:SAM-dependent methyltransferase